MAAEKMVPEEVVSIRCSSNFMYLTLFPTAYPFPLCYAKIILRGDRFQFSYKGCPKKSVP